MDLADGTIRFELNGTPVEIAATALNLLDVLRGGLGCLSVKDGCSPQGQCGCCTVLIDGQPRVACVTPARRVAGRTVTTLDGLNAERRQAWGAAFCATGASQCGFCTPGIVVRLDALADAAPAAGQTPTTEATAAVRRDHGPVGQALMAHLCRCTGWQTIFDAWDQFPLALALAAAPGPHAGSPGVSIEGGRPRDLEAAARRATLEGGVGQRVGPGVALGQGGFAADTAPDDALVALGDGDGGWVVGENLADARAQLRKVQGRRTTVAHQWPLEVPAGNWVATLRTTWVEPAYLEPDASWCQPGGEPYSTVANGGAFGAKLHSPVRAAARDLAERHGRPVLVLASREDATRFGPKRPPMAGGIGADGSGVLRVVQTPGITEAIAAVAPGLRVEEVEVVGPATSAGLRAAGWAEALVLLSALRPSAPLRLRGLSGADAEAELRDGRIRVLVRCGQVLDEVVLRSYCIGAAHMAWSWVMSEALTVDGGGRPIDLTIRSFGVVRAVDTPPIEVAIDLDDGSPPVNGSDAVFAAVAAATWQATGYAPDWPVGVPLGS
jgi:xanthine dehydrogenase small subunit